jgi:phosphoribosyl 1,2-cyclic phosphodiesterase
VLPFRNVIPVLVTGTHRAAIPARIRSTADVELFRLRALGHIPPYFFDRFRDLDCMAVESNYDPKMQADSPRPWFLKRRITGGHGHLSNPKALAAIRNLLDRARQLPDHIVLLHRSQACNCPELVRKLFSADLRIAPRLTLAQQHERSPWLGRTHRPPCVGEQLTLAL